MQTPSVVLQRVARDFADVIPRVDAEARHEEWKAGIGPFEEENQIQMILDGLADSDDTGVEIRTEMSYPGSQRRCDLLVQSGDVCLPVEAKLLRFRRDNGNVDPNMYKSVFSPFPERSSSSMLTDAKKLIGSDFDQPTGLLGLYYEKEDEEYEQLRAETIAEKFEQDVSYWYDIDIEIATLETFDGLQHPHHQHGAVITWLLSE
ncbi:transcriptional regulator [Haloarcula sp. H-GB4]|uniref:transcriptional regulator n=1 Tax=Haloarcula sp. H-GB4 TaxID=3069755 RepID=UPI0027AEFFD0|nr:transcriptional regulator [Haloarcula sp. H-GB4]MDQ2073529.1 transcriptional regulator [Haloarcula sp. H-GB4]